MRFYPDEFELVIRGTKPGTGQADTIIRPYATEAQARAAYAEVAAGKRINVRSAFICPPLYFGGQGPITLKAENTSA